MSVPGFESLILFVSDLAASRAFYVDHLGLPVLFEDGTIVVVGGRAARVVLHRNDRGHDERGLFPGADGVGGAAVRFAVDDPDECERQALESGPRYCGPPRRPHGGVLWSLPTPTAARSSWPG